MSLIIRPVLDLANPMYRCIQARDPDYKRGQIQWVIYAVLRITMAVAIFFFLKANAYLFSVDLNLPFQWNQRHIVKWFVVNFTISLTACMIYPYSDRFKLVLCQQSFYSSGWRESSRGSIDHDKGFDAAQTHKNFADRELVLDLAPVLGPS